MDKLRMKFSKTGRAVYISHLDLMRTITRAFMRSEIPLKYSEGFNPHPNSAAAVCRLRKRLRDHGFPPSHGA